MPYGGVKDSGLGREGVRYAMVNSTTSTPSNSLAHSHSYKQEDMVELKILVLREVGKL